MENPIASSELLRRCLLDRRDADWRLFKDRHENLLRRIVARLLLRRAPHAASVDLDDALQDVYFRLLRYGGSFAGSSDRELWAFLCRTAASVVVDLWRRAERRGGPLLVSAGLLRSHDPLLELGGGRRAARGRPSKTAPEGWLDRGPEALLLAREEVLRRFFRLPRRRRRQLLREGAAEGFGSRPLSPDRERR